MSDAVPQRYCDHKNRKDQVFEPAEDAGDPGSGNLRDRDLMQQLLEKPEGTEPSADSPAQNHTIEKQNPDNIPACTMTGRCHGILKRAERACADSARA